MNINKAHICGRITKDITVRSTQNGKSVASFSVATNQSWKDANGQKQDKATFHNIVMWGKLAEIAGQYLVKGQEVYIEGRIETRQYTNKQNVVRYITEIVADNMQMGQKPQNAPQQNPNSTYNQNVPPAEQDISTVKVAENADDIKIEDIPF
jgi:single-strand DNA-binding protein